MKVRLELRDPLQHDTVSVLEAGITTPAPPPTAVWIDGQLILQAEDEHFGRIVTLEIPAEWARAIKEATR